MKQELINQNRKEQLKITQGTSELNTALALATDLVDYFCRHDSFLKRDLDDEQVYVETVQEWAKYIGDLSKEQLRVGCEWYVSVSDKSLPRPLYFRRRCFGLPDSLEAFEMAKEDRYMHPAIYAAASKIPDRDWKEEKHNLRARFLMWYGQMCESIMNGVVINMPNKPDALGVEGFIPKYRERTPEETERGKEELAKLRQTIAEGAAKKEIKGKR